MAKVVDSELSALRRIVLILNQLPHDARVRIVTYLDDRFAEQPSPDVADAVAKIDQVLEEVVRGTQ